MRYLRPISGIFWLYRNTFRRKTSASFAPAANNILVLLTLCLVVACGPSSGQTIRTPIPVPTGPAQLSSNQSLVEPTTDIILFANIPRQTYTHASSQRFSIDYLANWQSFEQVDGVAFVDPTDQTGYRVFFNRADTTLTPDALNAFARQFIHDNFGGEANFEIVAQDNNSIRFKGTDVDFGPVMNELSFVQHEDLVYFILITAAENQWSGVAEALRDLARTLTFHSVAEPAPTSSLPPLWTLYGHPTEKFAFLYPDTWQIAETAQSVVVTSPEQQFIFSVEVIPSSGAGLDPAMVKAFTLERADELAGQFDDFQPVPLTTYQAGQGIGYTIDYLYTDETGLAIAGSIIVTATEDKLYHVSITAPALTYEDALAWFNPMMQSFQFLPVE